jgi:hypothetical protein
MPGRRRGECFLWFISSYHPNLLLYRKLRTNTHINQAYPRRDKSYVLCRVELPSYNLVKSIPPRPPGVRIQSYVPRLLGPSITPDLLRRGLDVYYG